MRCVASHHAVYKGTVVIVLVEIWCALSLMITFGIFSVYSIYLQTQLYGIEVH